MNGKMIGTKPLYVALAQRKDVRRQALESQMAQRNAQRMQYGGVNTMPQGPGFYGQPMYGYPPMPGYPIQPGMAGMQMRGPAMSYPGAPPMMGQPGVRPRYAPAQPGMSGMPMPYGMPPNGMAYGGMPPNYPVRPGNMGVRPPIASAANGPRVNGGPSPINMPQGLPAGAVPRGQMPVRPPQQGLPEQMQPAVPRLNAQALARAAPADQKQMLGESLYPLIHE